MCMQERELIWHVQGEQVRYTEVQSCGAGPPLLGWHWQPPLPPPPAPPPPQAAMNHLVKNLCCEWAKDGIRAISVAPW